MTAPKHILLMAGGEGTRFAPLSTPESPKQFLNLLDPNLSLFQQSLNRLRPLADFSEIWVTTNERYLPLVKGQAPTLTHSQIIGEPQKKNTAAGIAWVARACFEQNRESVLIVLPSDHFIPEGPKLCATLSQAADLAHTTQSIVTIGKKPTWAAAQFGYIQAEGQKVKRFVEKPDTATAQTYLNDGNYFWNLGMFIFPTGVLLQEIERHLPELHHALEHHNDLKKFYTLAPNISIDYGIMEKTDRAYMLEADFRWYDVGTWESLNDLVQQEKIKLDPKVEALLHSAKIAPMARQV